MEIRQLKMFCTAAKNLSFTKTAAELDYAQSNITAQIRLLEEELTVKLFERLGRNIQLTHDGHKFLKYAHKILQLSSEAKDQLIQSPTIQGKISIGAAESLCIYRLPALLQEYRRLYPNVEIHLEVTSCQQFPDLLRTNDIDVAFTLTQPIALPDMTTHVLIDEPMVFVANPTYKLTKKKSLRPADLNGECLILTEKTCGYRPSIMKMLEDFNVKTGPLLEFSSLGAIKKCVLIGLGISIMPLIVVNEHVKTGKLITFDWKGPNLGMQTQLIVHRDKWISPALRAFIDLTMTMINKDFI